ncbi:putative CAAX prenyl protease 2 [Helianthus anomalus]
MSPYFLIHSDIKRWSMSVLMVSVYTKGLIWKLSFFLFASLRFCLTLLMYIGSFIRKFISIWSSWTKHGDRQIDISFYGIKGGLQNLINWMISSVYNISAPLMEELVFRACLSCIILLLVCGGFKPYKVG